MARKGWTALKADTRERYERNGISRSDYERGESLKKARGHEYTPERPTQKNISRDYPSYYRERRQLIQAAANQRYGAWQNEPKFNLKDAAKHLENRPINDLKWLATATYEEIRDAVINDPKTYGWAGYHA